MCWISKKNGYCGEINLTEVYCNQNIYSYPQNILQCHVTTGAKSLGDVYNRAGILFYKNQERIHFNCNRCNQGITQPFHEPGRPLQPLFFWTQWNEERELTGAQLEQWERGEPVVYYPLVM